MSDEQKELLNQIQYFLETGNTGALADYLNQSRESDIAECVEILEDNDKKTVFDLLDEETCAEVLEKVDEATRDQLFEILSDEKLAVLINHLSSDDAADILSELDKDRLEDVLKQIPSEDSIEIQKLMTYSEDSAGGIMDPLVISVPEDATVAEAIEKIRESEIDEDFFSVYVVSQSGVFLGDVRIRLLLTNPANMKISELVDPDTVCVFVEDDQEAVQNVFRKNSLIVAPVLDRRHKLIGRITADRIIEVAEEEAAEDIYAMAGTDAEELERMSSLHAARIRMTWLLPCLIGTGVTAIVLMYFSKVFTSENMKMVYVVAFPFVPMIAAISGNAGLQTSAIVISGLAGGHLAAERLSQVFMREVKIALLVAVSCGVLGALVVTFLPGVLSSDSTENNPFIYDFYSHLRITAAFGAAMFSAIMVSTTLGLFLPFLFRKVGIDPAISSGPLVTTANDSISATIYMVLTFLLTTGM